jgi:hypothetical protein
MYEQHAPTPLDHLIGKEIGFLAITKPQEHRRTYEFAAWSTTLESDIGTYPILLRRGQFFPHALEVFAYVPATITYSYTEAHFGGVPITRMGCKGSPQGREHPDVGRADTFEMKRDLLTAVSGHDHTIFEGVRFEVYWEHLPLVETYACRQLGDALARCNRDGMSIIETGIGSKFDLVWSTRMTHYAHKYAADFAAHLAEIRDRIKHVSPNGVYTCSTFGDKKYNAMLRADTDAYIDTLRADLAEKKATEKRLAEVW